MIALEINLPVTINPGFHPFGKRVDSGGTDAMQDALGKLKKPVEKLQNPLPLPKKHVTTVMEYDYEVPDDDDYDYD